MTFKFHTFDIDTFLPKDKPVKIRTLRKILYSLPISPHPSKNLKRYAITQVSPTKEGVMISYVNDVKRAAVAKELNQNCPAYIFFHLYRLSVWPLDIYVMLIGCFSQAEVDLSLRHSVQDGTMVAYTPPNQTQQVDVVDRFFELEFEDEDDQPPQVPVFDGDVDTVASNQKKEEASTSAGYRFERNVAAMDIVERARLNLEAQQCLNPPRK